MENATKALIMAGGVLMSIIIIALLYMFITTLSANAEQEDILLLAEQTEKFNKEYEAFEKKLLRGTDLITVINKAIANNTKYEDQDKVYDIDVKFKLKTPVSKVTVTIEDGKQKATKEETVLDEELEYSIIDNKAKNRVNSKIYDFMMVGTNKTTDSYMIVDYVDERNYKKVYDNFTVFKRKIFKCTKIEYNTETGRVKLLEFEEILQSSTGRTRRI